MENTLNNSAIPEPKEGWLFAKSLRIPVPPTKRRGFLFGRIAPIAKVAGWTELPDLFPMFHTHSRLFWAWVFFASRLMPWGRLDDKLREKVILRVGFRMRCRYEWGQHVFIGQRVGLSKADIINTTFESRNISNAEDKLLMIAVDQQLEHGLIEASVWEKLEIKLTTKDLIELVVLIGHYQMVAGLLINSGLKLEPTLEKNLQNLFLS